MNLAMNSSKANPPHTPKTPRRGRSQNSSRSRSRPTGDDRSRAPLTPSLLAGLNSLSISNQLSPTKPRRRGAGDVGDITNPFITAQSRSRSRPASPVKLSTSISLSADLALQASRGVIRKGGIESRMDVIKDDYMPMKLEDGPKDGVKMKRSKSQPAAQRDRSGVDSRDRFIAARAEQEVTTALDLMSISLKSSRSTSASSLNSSTSGIQSQSQSSPGHTARLIEATGVPVDKRVLTFHQPPPVPTSDPMLASQRSIVRPLYARPPTLGTSTGAVTNKSRKIATRPDRVLDAPGILDDFYLNLITWSSEGTLGVALHDAVYSWTADTGEVQLVCEVNKVEEVASDAESSLYVSSVDFSNDGAFIAVGSGSGAVHLFDITTNKRLRTMKGHTAQVGVLSWNQHILSSGCADGSIWHHDVRIAKHKVMELLGHNGEVCGLKWRADGELLASGGNDNVVNIWDNRTTGEEGRRAVPRWTKRNHVAAVKALAWCPWQPSLLASGGGTNDATIHVWNTTTGARLHTLQTPAQVTSLHFSPHKKEILSTHGYPTNAIMVHAYPSMERVAEIRDAHDARVLGSVLGPAGDSICSVAGDENLKFWKIWEVPKTSGKSKGDKGASSAAGLSDTGLAIR